MAKIGRNDPCPCGSGKKYKQCHGPVYAARETEQRQLKQAQETLLAKVMEAAPRFATDFPDALERFWNGAYTVESLDELDDLEERGSERFLAWFFFDYQGAEGRTPVELLVEDPGDLDLTPPEAQLLPTWTDVRLQPYIVTEVRKGQGLAVRQLWNEAEIVLEDHAAARRVTVGEILVTHLTPAADTHYVAGSAAHITADTVEQLREWIDLHLNDLRTIRPDAGYADMIHDRSQIFNHFVMALPREEQPENRLQTLIENTRVIMASAALSLGLRRNMEQPAQRLEVPQADEREEVQESEAS
ncbi:MAG TPA: SEC-C metal-binding domain-containing protein [Herpetosiphonaceae bacterium]|nr:SEC-C metal-binding domain-containing protein [Herpetosiphonaceae bacterium]